MGKPSSFTSRQPRGLGATHVDGGCAAEPARGLVAPELCTLQPPHAGMPVHELLAGAPAAESGTVRNDQWLRQLAGYVRAGRASPERALLAACIFGEGVGSKWQAASDVEARSLVKEPG